MDKLPSTNEVAAILGGSARAVKWTGDTRTAHPDSRLAFASVGRYSPRPCEATSIQLADTLRETQHGEGVVRAACAVEIHFHEQDRASVFLENIGGPDAKFAELLLLSSYAVRQVANLGRSPETAALGALLAGAARSAEHLIGYRPENSPALVAYQGKPGRKRFTSRVDVADDTYQFNMQPHGFGFLGRGLGFYSPTSVVLLLQYLVELRLLDEEYLTALSLVAAMCALAIDNGHITVGSQQDVALGIAMSVTADKPSLRASLQMVSAAPDPDESRQDSAALLQLEPALRAILIAAAGSRDAGAWRAELEALRGSAEIRSSGAKTAFYVLGKHKTSLLREALPPAIAAETPEFSRDVAAAMMDGYVIAMRLVRDPIAQELDDSASPAPTIAEALVRDTERLPVSVSAEVSIGLRAFLNDWMRDRSQTGSLSHLDRQEAAAMAFVCFDLGFRLGLACYRLARV